MLTAGQTRLCIILPVIACASTLALNCEGYDMDELHPTHELKFEEAVKTLACSPDGSMIAAGLVSGEIALIDTTSWKVTGKFAATAEVVTGLGFSPDNKLLACCSDTDTVSIFEVKSHRLVRHVKDPDQQSSCTVQFSPDGKLLATGSLDGVVRVFSTTTWNPATNFREANARQVTPDSVPHIYKVAFRPQGGELAVGVRNGAILLSTSELTEQKGFPTSVRAVVDVAWSPNGKLLAAASDSAVVWNLDSPTESLTIPNAFQGTVNTVDFSSDGEFVLVGYSRGPRQQNTVGVFSLDHKKFVNHFTCYSNTLARAEFLPKTDRIVTANYAGFVSEWTVKLPQTK